MTKLDKRQKGCFWQGHTRSWFGQAAPHLGQEAWQNGQLMEWPLQQPFWVPPLHEASETGHLSAMLEKSELSWHAGPETTCQIHAQHIQYSQIFTIDHSIEKLAAWGTAQVPPQQKPLILPSARARETLSSQVTGNAMSSQLGVRMPSAMDLKPMTMWDTIFAIFMNRWQLCSQHFSNIPPTFSIFQHLPESHAASPWLSRSVIKCHQHWSWHAMAPCPRPGLLSSSLARAWSAATSKQQR